MNLRTRIILLTAVVLLGVAATTTFVVARHQEATARSWASGRLEAAVETAHQLGDERIEHLGAEAGLLIDALHLDALARRHDAAGAAAVLERFTSSHPGIDYVGLADAAGHSLASAGADLGRSLPLGLRSPFLEGIALARKHLFRFAMRPIRDSANGTLLGTVTVGEELDAAEAGRLSRLTGAEIVFVAGGLPVASSLPLGSVADVGRLARELSPGDVRTVSVAGKPFLARLDPLAAGDSSSALTPPGGGAGLLMLRTVASQPVDVPLVRDISLVSLSGLLVMMPLLWLGSRRHEQALGELTDSMAKTASTGELDRSLLEDRPARWVSSEVDALRVAFSGLMSTLEESLRDRERSYVEAVGAVVAAIDARDHETTGHSFRVAHYALALARALDVEGDRLRAIEWGSLLHDVGKIAVPDAILRKTGRLTEEEWHVMRQHPNWGFEMLADVKFLDPALEIVYSHHERWDGGGYPRGLAREEIPLAARIFAVVDTYDSITSDRPYRRARSHGEAVTELCRVAGTQLDPEVVEAFLRLPEVMLRRLRERSERLDLKVRIPDALTEMPMAGEAFRR